MSPFRLKTFQGLKFQKKIQSSLKSTGIKLNYFLKKDVQEVESLDHHFLCSCKYNADKILINPQFPKDLLENKIFLFSKDIMKIQVRDKVQDIEVGQLLDTVKEVKKQESSWQLDKVMNATVYLEKDSSQRLGFLSIKESEFYDELIKQLVMNYRTWIMEESGQGVDRYYLISERLKLLNVHLSAELICSKPKEISDALGKNPVSIDLLDVGEVWLLNKFLRERSYNSDILQKVRNLSNVSFFSQHELLKNVL